MLISIIVPAYNVEDYISRCLESIINQDISPREYEIIVINDGSTDGTLSIIKKYASKYSNIKIINQDNQGLSVARNIGLQSAIGTYAWFIDSDDWIVFDCFKLLLGLCEKYKLDMLEVAPSIKVVNNIDLYKNENLDNRVLPGKNILLNGDYAIGAWAYIFKRRFLNNENLNFLANCVNEDEEYIPRALYLAGRVALLKFSVYNYFSRPGSITKTFPISRLSSCIKVSGSLIHFRNQAVQEPKIKAIFSMRATQIFIVGLTAFANNKFPTSSYNEYLFKAKEECIYPLRYIPNQRFIVYFYVRLINCSPKLFIALKKSVNFIKRFTSK